MRSIAIGDDSISLGCDETCCDDCRLQILRHGGLSCTRCIKQIAPLLASENRRLYEENEQLS